MEWVSFEDASCDLSD